MRPEPKESPVKLLHYPDNALVRAAERVEDPGESAADVAREMVAVMREHSGIGLAANQVGMLKRIVVADVTGGEQTPMLLANPEILESSRETNVHEEGCLSLPGIVAQVKRPARVKVRAHDLAIGRPVEFTAFGMLATCLQHEVDHLDGILFVDRVSRLKRARLLSKYRKAAKRDKEPEAQAA